MAYLLSDMPRDLERAANYEVVWPYPDRTPSTRPELPHMSLDGNRAAARNFLSAEAELIRALHPPKSRKELLNAFPGWTTHQIDATLYRSLARGSIRRTKRATRRGRCAYYEPAP